MTANPHLDREIIICDWCHFSCYADHTAQGVCRNCRIRLIVRILWPALLIFAALLLLSWPLIRGAR
jgi:hypothetical protein